MFARRSLPKTRDSVGCGGGLLLVDTGRGRSRMPRRERMVTFERGVQTTWQRITTRAERVTYGRPAHRGPGRIIETGRYGHPAWVNCGLLCERNPMSAKCISNMDIPRAFQLLSGNVPAWW
ncbi:hypothetical protein LX36DRAFT_45090 [Colletotrichum falcatum]|nr:hypothetical protein LX36DRAFT_45090 [Colletotrichum falcatum]